MAPSAARIASGSSVTGGRQDADAIGESPELPQMTMDWRAGRCHRTPDTSDVRKRSVYGERASLAENSDFAVLVAIRRQKLDDQGTNGLGRTKLRRVLARHRPGAHRRAQRPRAQQVG